MAYSTDALLEYRSQDPYAVQPGLRKIRALRSHLRACTGPTYQWPDRHHNHRQSEIEGIRGLQIQGSECILGKKILAPHGPDSRLGTNRESRIQRQVNARRLRLRGKNVWSTYT